MAAAVRGPAPGALGLIPIASLAAILVYSGAKLVPLRRIGLLWREHRGEAAVLAVTATAIIATNLFEGVLAGIAVAVARSAWQTSHLHIAVENESGNRIENAPGDDTNTRSGPLRVRLSGNATFLRLPRLLDTLERLPADRPVELDWSGLRHLDHACAVALVTWAGLHRARSSEPLEVEPPLPTGV